MTEVCLPTSHFRKGHLSFIDNLLAGVVKRTSPPEKARVADAEFAQLRFHWSGSAGRVG
jgi:hypothetical protein